MGNPPLPEAPLLPAAFEAKFSLPRGHGLLHVAQEPRLFGEDILTASPRLPFLRSEVMVEGTPQ